MDNETARNKDTGCGVLRHKQKPENLQIGDLQDNDQVWRLGEHFEHYAEWGIRIIWI